MTAEFRCNQAEIKNRLNEMQSKLDVLKMSCTGKKEGKKKKKQNKTKQNKKQGGVSSGSIYCKSLDFPWSFPALLGQELALPLSFKLVFLGRACCADSQVWVRGRPATPPARCMVQWELFIL